MTWQELGATKKKTSPRHRAAPACLARSHGKQHGDFGASLTSVLSAVEARFQTRCGARVPRCDSKCCRRPSSSSFLDWCWRGLLQLFDPHQNISWRVRSNHRSVRGDFQCPNADAPCAFPACSPQTQSDALVCPLPQAWLPCICFTVLMVGAGGSRIPIQVPARRVWLRSDAALRAQKP